MQMMRRYLQTGQWELFEKFTQWIQFAYGHIQREIAALITDIPGESTALAGPGMHFGV